MILFLVLITLGIELLQFINTHELYSLSFLRRRADNTRGSPVRAALLWSMLEEARTCTENHFNLNQRNMPRPLRAAVSTITGEFCFCCSFSL